MKWIRIRDRSKSFFFVFKLPSTQFRHDIDTLFHALNDGWQMLQAETLEVHDVCVPCRETVDGVIAIIESHMPAHTITHFPRAVLVHTYINISMNRHKQRTGCKLPYLYFS